jgi:hypothetical protein
VPVTATRHCPVPVLRRRAKTSFPGRGPLRCAAWSFPPGVLKVSGACSVRQRQRRRGCSLGWSRPGVVVSPSPGGTRRCPPPRRRVRLLVPQGSGGSCARRDNSNWGELCPTYFNCFAGCMGSDGSITTFSGVRFWPLLPNPDDILILRRSREVTQVCSRKMTHQNDHLAQGKCAARMPRRVRRPARGWDTKTLRAFGADETASFISCLRARPVLRMGHSIGAQVGNFSRAPKF